MTGETPTPNASYVSANTAVTATFSEAVQPSTISFVLKDQNNNTVTTSPVSYNSATNTATWTPSTPLAYGTTYTATVSGAQDSSGNVMAAPFSWTFTTVASSTGPYSFWGPTATPTVSSANDSNSVELGVKFTSDVAGSITGIRFYKGAGNGGTHVGHLWDSAGNLLATATFTGETSSGWQQVSFASPVAISANTTYVASYYAPQGHYAADSGVLRDRGRRHPTAARAVQLGGRGQRCLRVRDGWDVPDRVVPVDQLLGRRRLQHCPVGQCASDDGRSAIDDGHGGSAIDGGRGAIDDEPERNRIQPSQQPSKTVKTVQVLSSSGSVFAGSGISSSRRSSTRAGPRPGRTSSGMPICRPERAWSSRSAPAIHRRPITSWSAWSVVGNGGVIPQAHQGAICDTA